MEIASSGRAKALLATTSWEVIYLQILSTQRKEDNPDLKGFPHLHLRAVQVS